ncbi:MAG: sugar phosphate isomerase/epimerase [Trueperaceae bacterium]|nr:sugar phosphate isomerase/epimerase [Trueperaceae bacterium]
MTTPGMGHNTFIWRSPFSTASDLDLVDHVAALGAEVLEIAVEEPSLVEGAALAAALDARGLGAVVCGAFGPERDVGALDPATRERTLSYLVALFDLAARIGADLVVGPAFGSVGLARPLPPEERRAERDRVVQALREVAPEAASRGVRLALEPLNRFETDRINTARQGLDLCDDVGHDAVGLLLDSFHMHLEEKSSGAALRSAGDRLFHVHASENDRGVPGTGQVAWREIATALQETDYRGYVVIESFTPAVTSIAGAVCLWREVAPSQDAIAADGLAFLRSLWR